MYTMLSKDTSCHKQSMYCHERAQRIWSAQSEMQGWQTSVSLQGRLAGWEYFLVVTAFLCWFYELFTQEPKWVCSEVCICPFCTRLSKLKTKSEPSSKYKIKRGDFRGIHCIQSLQNKTRNPSSRLRSCCHFQNIPLQHQRIGLLCTLQYSSAGIARIPVQKHSQNRFHC